MIAFVTLCTPSYQRQADILVESIRRFHPESPVEVNVLDDVVGMVEKRPQMVIDALTRHSKICFLGSDTQLFARIDDADQLLDIYDFAAVPHICSPLPDDGLHPSESQCLAVGACNSDVQFWRRSSNTSEILAWYSSRVERHGAKVDLCHGYFAEQSWLNMIPYLFDGCHVWRTRTINVAYWNAHLYNLRLADVWMTDGGPLQIFHYSGFDVNDVAGMSRHQDRYIASGDVLKLYSDYAAELQLPDAIYDAEGKAQKPDEDSPVK